MAKRLTLISVFLLILVIFPVIALNAQISLDLESGLVTTGYNDVRIPGNQGTLFFIE